MPKYTIEPKEVLSKYRTVAVVGASKNPEKEAYSVPAYLQRQGYTIIPVNPTVDSVHGVRAYPSLADIPDEKARTVDIVDVFRPSEEFPGLAKQVVEMKKRTGRPFVFWGQLRLENEEAKKILTAAKVDYVMDRCIRTEHQVLGIAPVGGKKKINEAWHNQHRMPENPSREQRVSWHLEHARACGCRPVPEDLADDVRSMMPAGAQAARSI
jgi:predicted CoA-binding protein